jgi:hypothetical protein
MKKSFQWFHLVLMIIAMFDEPKLVSIQTTLAHSFHSSYLYEKYMPFRQKEFNDE